MPKPPKKKAPIKRKKANLCKNQIENQKCHGNYILDSSNAIPLFVCDTCGDIEKTWEKFYSEYLHLHEIKENWLEQKHKVSCIIGYFCYLYKKKFKTDYVFVPENVNPFSSLECKYTAVLLSTFNNDALEVRKYLKWLFDKELRGHTKITSFGYLKVPGIIRKYQLYRCEQKVVTRVSKLPKQFIDWCKKNTKIFDNYSLDNYNDLVAVYNCVKTYNIDKNKDENKVLEKAESMRLIVDGKIISN